MKDTMFKQLLTACTQAKDHEVKACLTELVHYLHDNNIQPVYDCIALGRFQDGQNVSDKEQELLMQAIVLYEHMYVPIEKRTGFIERDSCHSRS